MRLKDKVALITGAGGGIGRESALLFAREGASVVVVDVNDEAGNETVELVRSQEGRAVYVHADVSKAADCELMVAVAEKEFGKLNALFNNAGTMHHSDDNAVTTEESVWDLTMNVNAKGVFLGCKYGVPALRRAGGGSIINTASFVALMGAATPQIAYTASKGASARPDARAGRHPRARKHPGQRALPGASAYRAADELPEHRRKEAAAIGTHPDGALRRGEGDRAGGVVSGLG